MTSLMEISCLNLYESPSEISLKHFWFGLNHSIIPFSESLLLFGPLSHYSDRVKIDSDQQFMKIHCDSDIICNDSEAFRCSSEKFRKGSEAFSHESEILRSIQTWLRSIQTYLVMIQKQCSLIQRYLAMILIYLVMIRQYSGTIQSEFRNFQLKFIKIQLKFRIFQHHPTPSLMGSLYWPHLRLNMPNVLSLLPSKLYIIIKFVVWSLST